MMYVYIFFIYLKYKVIYGTIAGQSVSLHCNVRSVDFQRRPRGFYIELQGWVLKSSPPSTEDKPFYEGPEVTSSTSITFLPLQMLLLYGFAA
jgi:hypothetical protein